MRGGDILENNNIEKLLKALLDEQNYLLFRLRLKPSENLMLISLHRFKWPQSMSQFDGVRTLQQISTDINCKLNTLQVFAQQLVDKDLVDYEMKGNARILSKSLSKIAVYYANKELGEAQNG